MKKPYVSTSAFTSRFNKGKALSNAKKTGAGALRNLRSKRK